MKIPSIGLINNQVNTQKKIDNIPSYLSERVELPRLIYNDPVTNKEAIFCRSWAYGSQMSVFYSDEYTKEHPIFTVKMWDKDGGYITDEIDGSKVDPSNATVLELLAFGAYCEERGFPENAAMCIGDMLAGSDMEPIHYSVENAQEKYNFILPLKELMKLTNHPAYSFYYLTYKTMYDFILEKATKNNNY